MAKSFYAASQKVAEQNTDLFYADKMFSALYYIQQILPLASSYSERVCAGGNMMVAANNDWFDRAY